MKSGIYSIVNTVNNKLYIGSSKNLHRRQLEHFRNLRNNKHSNNHLQTAWNKYEEKSFIFTIIEECEVGVLLDREQYYIDSYKSYDRTIGYNKSLVAKGIILPPRTHCKNNHELSGDNLYENNGERICKKCKSDKAKLKYIKKERLKIRPKRKFCYKGHELTEENTGFHNRSSGRISRYCKLCSRVRDKNFRDKVNNN